MVPMFPVKPDDNFFSLIITHSIPSKDNRLPVEARPPLTNVAELSSLITCVYKKSYGISGILPPQFVLEISRCALHTGQFD